MLHRAPRFNISSVVWGPGDNAKAHNHDTWGMVGVIENEIQETRFRRKDDGSRNDYADLETTAVLRNRAGMVSCLVSPNDDIHGRSTHGRPEQHRDISAGRIQSDRAL